MPADAILMANVVATGALAAFLAVSAAAFAIRFRRAARTFERVEREGVRFAPWRRTMEISYWTTEALGRPLAALGVRPNTISFTSLGCAGVAGVLFALGQFGIGSLFFFACGVLDLADGMVARMSGRRRPSGAVVDSSLDRYADFVVLAGLAVYYRADAGLLALVLLAILGSVMVSYSSAKAEAMGIALRRGLMKRPERGTLLLVGAALSPLSQSLVEPALWGHAATALPMIATVMIVAVGANVAAVRRLRELAVAADARPEATAPSGGDT